MIFNANSVAVMAHLLMSFLHCC